MKYIISIFAVLFLGGNSFSQTGPGGIGDNTTNPYWLDAHTMGGANGSKVASWTDYSGNGNHAIEASVPTQPTFVTNALNGRSAVDFDGSHYLTSGAEPNMDNVSKISIFLVANVESTPTYGMGVGLDYGSGNFNTFGGIQMFSGDVYSYGRKPPVVRTAFDPPIGTMQIYQYKYDKPANTLSSIRNFSLNNSLTANLLTAPNHEQFWIGGTLLNGSGNYFTDMKAGEIIIFNYDLNSTEQKILENYLSAKYGTATTSDMYTFEGTYGLGVVGIGQDAAATAHTNSIGNGYVRISNPADLQDGEYLFVGHDDVDIASFSTNVPTSISATASRFSRQWRVEKTPGDLGNITLTFDLDPSTDFSADPSNYRLLVHSASNMSGTIDHILSGTYNAGANTITFTGVDLQTGDFFTLAGDTPGEIHSITDGGWNTPGTWDCTCIPTAFNEVYIDPGTNVTVDVDANSFGLYVEAGGNLIMNAPFTLNIYDAFEIANTGTVNFTDGKVAMVGNIDQGINAFGATVDFHDLEINNSTGSNVDLFSSVYNLNGSLLMEKGHLIIDNSAGGLFIVRSISPTTSGRIGEIKAGATISGNVRVERFIAGGTADWRNMSSPIANTDLSDWDNEMFISGTGFPDGCAYGPNGCFFSVREHKVGVFSDVTNPNLPLVPGRGYEVFVGDDLNSYAGGTVNLNGQLNTSAGVSISYSHDWNTLGNPFASPILFSTLSKFSTTGKYFYVYDAATGGYQWYDESSNTSSIPQLANGLLASGQGFWTNGWGTLIFNQSDKVDQTATFIRSNETIDNSIYLTLSEMNSTYSTTISFEESEICLDGFDTIQDVMHLSTGHEKCPTLAIETSEDLLRKNWMNDEIKDKTYDLFSKFLNEGYYSIEAENMESFNNYSKVVLFDNETQEFIDLKTSPSYVFYSNAGEFNRFSLIFSNDPDIAVNELGTASINEMTDGITIVQMGNIVNVKSSNLEENVSVVLYNSLGQETARFNTSSLSEGDNLITVPSDIKGVHILSINFDGNRITKKLVF